MLKTVLLRCFLAAISCALLASCGGGGDLGGGVGEFTTVSATATAATARLESDLSTGNTCSATGSTGGTFVTDSVDVVLSSKVLATNGALDLLVSRITVHYEPVNASVPRLPDYFLTSGERVVPGGSVTIPVPVVPDNLKLALATGTGLNDTLDLCSTDYFEYYVTITLEVSEPGGNGKTRDVTAKLNVAIADRAE